MALMNTPANRCKRLRDIWGDVAAQPAYCGPRCSVDSPSALTEGTLLGD